MNLKLRYLITLICTCLFMLAGCDGEENQPKPLRKVQFKIAAPSNGRTMAAFNPDALLVSIEDVSGVSFYDLEKIEIYQLNDGYISVPVSLPQGSYKLTLFALTDSDDNIIAATPTEDSPVAEFVNDPLPIEFDVTSAETTFLNPEVVVIEEGIDIGYAVFGIDIVNLHPVSISVFQNDEGIRGEIISASLTIEGYKYNEGEMTWEKFWTKSIELDANTNSVYIKGGNDKFDGITEPDNYYFTIQKPGFYPATYALNSGELKNFPDQIFDLIKNYTQLKSITADVYCCPGYGFLPNKTTFTYNSLGQLDKTTYQYKFDNQWQVTSTADNALGFDMILGDILHNGTSVVPHSTEYIYPAGGHTYINSTQSHGGIIIGMETFDTSGGTEMGSYLISLTRNPSNPRLITDATLYDKDYNSTLNFHYTYDAQGDLVMFEAKQGNHLLYRGEFTYDNYANVYPQHMLGNFLENMTNAGYDWLLHIPFMIHKPKHNIVNYVLSMYTEAEGLFSKETVTMNYTYDNEGRPSSLGVQNKVEMPGHDTYETERQKNTVFQYN